MVSIARRTAVLAFARLTTQLLAFLGPVLLVRMLTLEQYGQYRDFLLYATLLLPWIRLDVNSSLTYFIPKEPANERIYFSQATLFVFVSSAVVVAAVVVFSDYFPSDTAKAYVLPLCMYLIFQANLDAWEFYWLAKHQTSKVMYYSIGRLGLRMSIVVCAAYFSRNVGTIIWAMVIFEAIRFFGFALFSASRRFLILRFRFKSLGNQLHFVLPLALSAIVFNVNANAGQFVISTRLGVATLAIYSVGAYLEPIIRVFRNSVADVIFPEIVSKRELPVNEALHLWQRATVVYCAVLFPVATLLYYYAEVVVTTLFTIEYVAATPVFRILTLALIYQCFDFALPLRAVRRTHVFVASSLVSLVLNIILLFALFATLGIIAPAIAQVVSVVLGMAYLAIFVVKYCGFSARKLLPWTEIGKVALATLACLPLLYLGEGIDMPPLTRSIVVGLVYVLCFGLLMRYSAIPEVTSAFERILSHGLGRRGAR